MQIASVLKECDGYIGAKCYQFEGMRETLKKATPGPLTSLTDRCLSMRPQRIDLNLRPHFDRVQPEFVAGDVGQMIPITHQSIRLQRDE